MKTLLNTYTVIETHEHVKALSEHLDWLCHIFIGDAIAMGENLDEHDFDAFDPDDLPHRTRVTVEQYIDLMTDRITPWRLEEAGFIQCATPDVMMMETAHGVLMVSDIEVWMNEVQVPYNIETFSELQTLIKYLTPKP